MDIPETSIITIIYTDKCFDVEISSSYTLEEIKPYLSAALESTLNISVPADRFNLIAEGKALPENKTIEELGLFDGTNLFINHK